jgi:galactokinase
MIFMNSIRPFIERLYGAIPDKIVPQIERYERIDRDFVHRFGDRHRCCFSAPGRTELGGNHTDHNHGRVLAAAIDHDMAAVAAANTAMTVTVHSEGYKEPFVVDLTDLSVREEERETTVSIIRGIAGRFKALGHAIGGFDACMASDVLKGSGLSSSAAVEVLFGTIFNALFNDGRIDPAEIARIGQYAENIYFGKPCGLMDQMASAVGGVVAIDFRDPEAPDVRKITFDFNAHGYDLMVVDTGGNHFDLTDDYASVPREMKLVAGHFGSETLREVELERFTGEIPGLRRKFGDRAVLRALHFFGENDRVARQVDALSGNDMAQFIRLARSSGDSSIKWLQNVYSTKDVASQGMPLALAMTERFLSGKKSGAFRVHGGGFAGAILVILPSSRTEEYTVYIEKVFGHGTVRKFAIRRDGATYYDPKL